VTVIYEFLKIIVIDNNLYKHSVDE